MSYVGLHQHSMYSVLDGMSKIPEMVARCKELGMNATALTDHGVMYGIIEFYHACKDAGIKPILGCEVYVAPKSRFDKDNHNRYNHLLLLAETNEGFYNLQKICTEGFKGGFYYKPRVDDDILRQYHNGIICLSGCLAGRIPRMLAAGQYKDAKDAALNYKELFGEDNFFLEMQDHGIQEQKIVNRGLMQISKETGIPLVVSNDAHYVLESDADAHDVLLAMQQKTTLSDQNRLKDVEKQYFIKSEDEMRKIFYYAPEAIENSQKIADRCNVELVFHETKIPKYPVPEGLDAFSYLRHLCEKGLESRYEDITNNIRKQVDYELSVIKKMGYTEYFLIVWDYIKWCRDNNIPVGPGRGSAAGSIVSYAIGITNIDPLRYDLQFERFLNPERVSMPDIDVDFCMRRREEIIDHVKEMYGQDNVCQIITIGTMAAKAAIKDTGKVLGYEFQFRDRITKMIPNEPGITIRQALDEVQELRDFYNSDSDVKLILDTAMRIEGLPKSTGTHAAGVIIGAKPVSEYIPLARNAEGEGMVSQYTMTAVEELGLLKMDFLGLRTLTAIQDAIDAANAKTGKKLNIQDINYDDPEVFALIGTGNTNGIFQLESKGMQDFMKKLQPKSLEDLIAGISLYRPGPMDFIPRYLEWKNHPDRIEYPCEQLRPILQNTYGCIVYQEQVTRIVRDLAGYTMGQADNIRRAMSKKKQYIIDEERKSFVYGDDSRDIPGCVKNGIHEEVANKIYDSMVDFAKYAFNKSHAACYAVIGYQTAWLMKYYPAEYWAATMTSVINNTKKLVEYIHAAKSNGIKLIPPDINKSTEKFTAEDGGIRYAASGIKGISIDTAQKIIDDRTNNGDYTSFCDTVKRLSRIGIGKDGILNLIWAGAFDCFKGNRKQFEMSFEDIMKGDRKELKNNIDGQISLFDTGALQREEFKLPYAKDYLPNAKLMLEKKASGVYISGHPLESKQEYLNKYNTYSSLDLQIDEWGGCALKTGDPIKICALVTEINRKITSKGDWMAFITVEDLAGQFEVIVFPKAYNLCSDISEDDMVLISGKIQVDEEKGVSVIAETIQNLRTLPKTLWIQYPSMEVYLQDDFIANMPKGKDSLAVYIKETKRIKKMQNYVELTDSLEHEILEHYSADDIRFVV